MDNVLTIDCPSFFILWCFTAAPLGLLIMAGGVELLGDDDTGAGCLTMLVGVGILGSLFWGPSVGLCSN